MNVAKTGFLMMVMTGLFMIFGYAVGGEQGMVLALVIAVVSNGFMYWFSDSLVLRAYNAQEITRTQMPDVYEMVERLAKRAELPMPKVYLIPSPAPNAFATGRNPSHAAVALTQGLYDMLSPAEVEGVLAHEMAHVKHRDILTATIVGTLAGAIGVLASIARWGAILGGGRDDDEGGGIVGLIVMSIVMPLIAMVIQMAISRSREFHADQTGGELTGHPEYLARALEKISVGNQVRPMHNAQPATAHLFISNPLSGKRIANLFSTHPAMEDRVKRLLDQASSMRR